MNSNRNLLIIAIVGLVLAASAIMFLKPGSDAGANANVTQVTTTTFEDEVLDSTTPVVIDFYSENCQPCEQYSPVFEKVSGDYVGKAKFVSVNVDKNPELARMFGIQVVPTTMIVRPEANGTYSVGGVPGVLPEQALKQVLTMALDPATELIPAKFEKDGNGNLTLLPVQTDPDPAPDVKDNPAKK